MAGPQNSGKGGCFRLTEEASLEGTFRVIIRAPRPLGLEESAAILRYGNRQCAVLSEAAEGGPSQRSS
jgi:hypothetical protein